MQPMLLPTEQAFAICTVPGKQPVAALSWHDSKVVCFLSNMYDPRDAHFEDTGKPAKFSVPFSGQRDALKISKKNRRTRYPQFKKKGSYKKLGGILSIPLVTFVSVTSMILSLLWFFFLKIINYNTGIQEELSCS